MIIKGHDLKVIEFTVNPIYVDKYKTLCSHNVTATPSIHYVDHKKRELGLRIAVSFTSKQDCVNVVNSLFLKFYHIELEGNETNPVIFNVFHHGIIGAFEEVNAYLSENVPSAIVQIEPPLIMAYEKQELATSIFEKLITPSAL